MIGDLGGVRVLLGGAVCAAQFMSEKTFRFADALGSAGDERSLGVHIEKLKFERRASRVDDKHFHAGAFG